LRCFGTSETDVSGHRRQQLAEWLVVAARVERELAEELALDREHAYVAIGDEQEHTLAFVHASETDVVEPAAIAKRDGAAGVDPVVADPVVAGEGVAVVLGLGLDRASPAGRSRMPLRIEDSGLPR
jgi:hypothetical protein